MPLDERYSLAELRSVLKADEKLTPNGEYLTSGGTKEAAYYETLTAIVLDPSTDISNDGFKRQSIDEAFANVEILTNDQKEKN